MIEFLLSIPVLDPVLEILLSVPVLGFVLEFLLWTPVLTFVAGLILGAIGGVILFVIGLRRAMWREWYYKHVGYGTPGL